MKRAFVGSIVLFVAIACLLASRGLSLPAIETLLRQAREFGGLGWLIFLLVQVGVAVSGVLPASLLGIAAGAIYGAAGGFVLAAAGTMLGAYSAFGLSRSLLRPQVETLLRRRPRLNHIDAELHRGGWRMVLLLRISPVMPFSATSFLMGLSGVRVRDYLAGTIAAMPALACYVVAGSMADAGLAAAEGAIQPWRWALLAIGLVSTAVLTVQIGRIALQAR